LFELFQRRRPEGGLELGEVGVEGSDLCEPVELVDQGRSGNTRHVQTCSACLRDDVVRNGDVDPGHAHRIHTERGRAVTPEIRAAKFRGYNPDDVNALLDVFASPEGTTPSADPTF